MENMFILWVYLVYYNCTPDWPSCFYFLGDNVCERLVGF